MRKFLMMALVAGTLVPTQAQAFGHCQTESGTGLSAASASNAHATDEANDYGGLVFGTGSGSEPMGDIYREGTDLLAGWLDRGSGGNLRANAKVVDLGVGAMANVNFYVAWQYEGSDAAKSQRWASARLKGYGVEFTYGYMAPSSIPTSNASFATVGVTTGLIDLENDTVSINLPEGDWGTPQQGAILRTVTAESRVLLGSPEPLPSNPLGLRHGFVYPVDIADSVCNAIVD